MENSNKIPDDLRCPICAQVPLGHVYQCREGHYLCDKCYAKLTLSRCPQCRVKFDIKPIRNLAIETMLDKLDFNCPFADRGCKKKLKRDCLQKHAEVCYFDVKKFGSFKYMCIMMGFPDCEFKVNRGNGNETIEHLKTVHNAQFYDLNSVAIKFANYKDFFGGIQPIILNRKEEGYAFVILMVPKRFGVLEWKVSYLMFPTQQALIDPGNKRLLSFEVECSLMDSFAQNWSSINILTYLVKPRLFSPETLSMNVELDKFGSVYAQIKIRKLAEDKHDQEQNSPVPNCRRSLEDLILDPYSIPNISKPIRRTNVSTENSTIVITSSPWLLGGMVPVSDSSPVSKPITILTSSIDSTPRVSCDIHESTLATTSPSVAADTTVPIGSNSTAVSTPVTSLNITSKLSTLKMLESENNGSLPITTSSSVVGSNEINTASVSKPSVNELSNTPLFPRTSDSSKSLSQTATSWNNQLPITSTSCAISLTTTSDNVDATKKDSSSANSAAMASLPPIKAKDSGLKWSCPTCMVKNELAAQACVCCGEKNPNNKGEKREEALPSAASASSIKFGISASTGTGTTSGPSTSSGNYLFVFGQPASTEKFSLSTFKFGAATVASSISSIVPAVPTVTTSAPFTKLSSPPATNTFTFGDTPATTLPSSTPTPSFGVGSLLATTSQPAITTNVPTTTTPVFGISKLTSATAIAATAISKSTTPASNSIFGSTTFQSTSSVSQPEAPTPTINPQKAAPSFTFGSSLGATPSPSFGTFSFGKRKSPAQSQRTAQSTAPSSILSKNPLVSNSVPALGIGNAPRISFCANSPSPSSPFGQPPTNPTPQPPPPGILKFGCGTPNRMSPTPTPPPSFNISMTTNLNGSAAPPSSSDLPLFGNSTQPNPNAGSQLPPSLFQFNAAPTPSDSPSGNRINKAVRRFNK